MIGALRPPEAFIPRRGWQREFLRQQPSGRQHDRHRQSETGRQNNQGFEGMSISPDGHTLFVVNQSALRQDLDAGNVAATRRNVRLLAYDITAAPAFDP